MTTPIHRSGRSGPRPRPVPRPRPRRPRDGGPRARVRGLGEVAAIVPYLLGFRPHESIVVLGMHGRDVGLTARVDLPAALEPGWSDPLDDALTAIAFHGADRVNVLVASEADALDPALLDELRDLVGLAGLELGDVGWQRGTRCLPLLDRAEGEPGGWLPVDTACQAVAAAAFAGAVALPSREDVEAEFERPPGTDPDRLLPFLLTEEDQALADTLLAIDRIAGVRGRPEGGAAPHARLPRVLHTATSVLAAARAHDACVAEGRAPAPLTDAEVAGLVVALADVTVRDAAWTALDAGEVDGRGLWLELAHRAPPPYDAAPLFLLGWRWWRRGDLLRARLAAERAARVPGGYSAARLLLDAVSSCVDPATIPRLRA